MQLLSFDLTSTDAEMHGVGQPLTVAEPFHRLIWGPSVDAAALPMGLLGGGMADGTVVLWDPAALQDPSRGKPAQVAKLSKHQGAVRGLEINASAPNMLASGAADGDVIIWDLSNPGAPSAFPALKASLLGTGQIASCARFEPWPLLPCLQPTSGHGAGTPGEITCLSWNRKVQHILASGTSQGSTVVWDLKKQKPVITFADPNMRRRPSCIAWNPEVATQLVVASDDDRCPTLQLWDLRNSTSPLQEFVGHAKGVLAMDWSPHDPGMLMSSGKDNRTLCWDLSGEIVAECSPAAQWSFDLRWAPEVPGLFATASFDGKVSLYNLLSCGKAETVQVVNPVDFSVTTSTVGPAAPLRRCPQWVKRPCGASFGFGGKLLSFANRKVPGPDGALVQSGYVNVSPVVTDTDLVAKGEQFEQALAGGDRSALAQYCQWRAQAEQAAESREVWTYMSSQLADGAGRAQLLQMLGFEIRPPQPAAIDPAAAPLEGQHSAAAQQQMAELSLGGGADALAVGDADSFFENLGEQPQQLAPSPKQQLMQQQDGTRTSGASPGLSPQAAASAEDHEIQRCIVSGDFEGAVAVCLRSGRLSDALILASVGGAELFGATQRECMRRTPRHYMKVVDAILHNGKCSPRLRASRKSVHTHTPLGGICLLPLPEGYIRVLPLLQTCAPRSSPGPWATGRRRWPCSAPMRSPRTGRVSAPSWPPGSSWPAAGTLPSSATWQGATWRRPCGCGRRSCSPGTPPRCRRWWRRGW